MFKHIESVKCVGVKGRIPFSCKSKKCSKSLDQGLKGKKSCPNWAVFRSLKRFQKTLQQFVIA
jgi:hypothetical protein